MSTDTLDLAAVAPPGLTERDWRPKKAPAVVGRHSIRIHCIPRRGATSTESEPAPWLQAAADRVADLLILPENWDSYGAKQVNVELAVSALNLLTQIMRDGTPVPSIVPTNSGGIQLEWHRNGVDLEIEVISARKFGVLFVDPASGEERDEVISSNLRTLARAIARLG